MPEIENRADLAQNVITLIDDYNMLHLNDVRERVATAMILETGSLAWQDCLEDDKTDLDFMTQEALELFHDQHDHTTAEHCLAVYLLVCERIRELTGNTSEPLVPPVD